MFPQCNSLQREFYQPEQEFPLQAKDTLAYFATVPPE